MRVTFVVTSEILGGGELYLLRFAKTLSMYASVRVVGGYGTPIVEKAEESDLPVEILDLGRKLSARTAAYDMLLYPLARRRLDALIRESPRGEIFVFQYKWEQLLWGGRHSEDRVILWEHGPIPAGILKNRWTRRRLRNAYRRAREVFAMSVPAQYSIVDLAQREPKLLPAGLDLDACYLARSAREQTRANIECYGQVVGFVGRVTEDKGILSAVRVLASLPGATLLVCGEGPARVGAEELAHRLGVAERIRWLGWREDVLNIIAALDAVLLLSTSHGEGRPLVALESLAVGTPVVGFAGTAALDAMGNEAGIYLATQHGQPSVIHTVTAALARPRPKPAGSDWSESVTAFLSAISCRSEELAV